MWNQCPEQQGFNRGNVEQMWCFLVPHLLKLQQDFLSEPKGLFCLGAVRFGVFQCECVNVEKGKRLAKGGYFVSWHWVVLRGPGAVV